MILRFQKYFSSGSDNAGILVQTIRRSSTSSFYSCSLAFTLYFYKSIGKCQKLGFLYILS